MRPASRNFTYAPWLLVAIVCSLAIYVWGHSFDWEFRAINAYQFFPMLGLLAFSIMWTQYMTDAAMRIGAIHNTPANYFRYTGHVVLACIVLHPSILVYSLFRDGFGLPPGSYEKFVAPGMAWVTLLGTASLLAFLAFELHRWYGRKSWWKYVLLASDIALLAIFYHGLRLGSQLQGGWYRGVWWFYGITLLAAIVYKYAVELRARRVPAPGR